jgi:hypothetical protein
LTLMQAIMSDPRGSYPESSGNGFLLDSCC